MREESPNNESGGANPHIFLRSFVSSFSTKVSALTDHATDKKIAKTAENEMYVFRELLSKVEMRHQRIFKVFFTNSSTVYSGFCCLIF